MKKRIRPALGLKIRTAKHQFILLPFATISLFALGFVFLPYLEASFRASATGSNTAQVSTDISDAWARLTTSGNVSMVAENPSASGTIVSGRANVIAATNAPSGYSLYLSANNSAYDTAHSATSTTSLFNADVANAEINAMPSTGTSTFSTLNTWGYGVKGSDRVSGFSNDYTTDLTTSLFKGVAATSQAAAGLIAQSDAARSNGVITDIYYAAYVSAATPNGTYSADVTYTLVADFVPGLTDPNIPTSGSDANDYAYTDNGTKYYYTSTPGDYYYYNNGTPKTVTALGVNKTEDDTITTIANINDGNITWAAIAIVAGASATFLAIALLRDRSDEDEEE